MEKVLVEKKCKNGIFVDGKTITSYIIEDKGDCFNLNMSFKDDAICGNFDFWLEDINVNFKDGDGIDDVVFFTVFNVDSLKPVKISHKHVLPLDYFKSFDNKIVVGILCNEDVIENLIKNVYKGISAFA